MPTNPEAGTAVTTNGAHGNGQPPKRPRLTSDERVAQNRKLLQQYGSHIIVPHSAEGRILIQMVYPLNKAIPWLRRDLQVRRTVAEVMAILKPIMDWTVEASEWLRRSGGEMILMTPTAGEMAGERERMVTNPRAHVIVPQTPEVRRVLEQAIRMDRVLVCLRMSSLEQLREEPRLAEAFELVRSLDRAVQSVCVSVGVKYFSPKDVHRRRSRDAEDFLPITGQAKA